jgi:putative ABC transport system permease protein
MDDCNRTASELSDLFDRHNIPVRAVETIPMLRQTSDVSFSYVIVMLMVLACIVALVGGIGLMGSLWIGVIERTKEIGILRAVGAVSPLIVRMFLLEGLLQGLMSWVMAVPLSLLVTPWMAEVLGQTMFNSSMEYSYNYAAVLTWLGVIVGLSSLASIIPARSATRINVRQSLNYE